MLMIPADEMTLDQLEYRIEFHESTAAMFEERHEAGAARRFRELANVYRTELNRRPPGASSIPVNGVEAATVLQKKEGPYDEPIHGISS